MFQMKVIQLSATKHSILKPLFIYFSQLRNVFKILAHSIKRVLNEAKIQVIKSF